MLENTCLFHHKILCTSNLYILFNYLLVIIIYILLIIYLLVFYVPMSINFMVSCRRYNNYFWPLFIIAIFYLLDIINNSSPKLIFEHVFFFNFQTFILGVGASSRFGSFRFIHQGFDYNIESAAQPGCQNPRSISVQCQRCFWALAQSIRGIKITLFNCENL